MLYGTSRSDTGLWISNGDRLMFKENFQNLFADFEPEIQTLITRVLSFEQKHITHESGRMTQKMKEELDQIITQVAMSKQVGRERDNVDSE